MNKSFDFSRDMRSFNRIEKKRKRNVYVVEYFFNNVKYLLHTINDNTCGIRYSRSEKYVEVIKETEKVFVESVH